MPNKRMILTNGPFWESKRDDSLESSLFVLIQPHGGA